jgi:alkanesulfonate monooxygenase
MQLCIFTEPQQGATYEELLAVAQATERLGFDGFFRADHYLAMNRPGGAGPSDAWITLAGLARETERIRLGTLVTSATFRWPGPLAIEVAGVDRMSGGRVELGVGAGWFEAEHRAYGIPFPELGERFDRLEETLAILTGLWTVPEGETFGYAGRHYQLDGSPGLPKPRQRPHPPIIIGGQGRRRTPELAARYAAEFNVAFQPLDAAHAQFDRVRAACAAIDRDPASMGWSLALATCVGSDEAEFARRAAAIDRDPDELREAGIAGTVADARGALARCAEIGADRVYLQVLDLGDLAHLELLAAELLPVAAQLG